MGRSNAHTIVIVTSALMVGYVLMQSNRVGAERTYKGLWAVGLLSLGLSFLADVAPQLAGPFALLVLIGAYMKHPGIFGSFVREGAGTAKGG